MRLVIALAAIGLGVGILACQWESGPTDASLAAGSPSTAAESVRWVRTADGWERAGRWESSIVEPPPLHPLVVAAGQVLASLMALLVTGEHKPRTDAGALSARPHQRRLTVGRRQSAASH